MGVASRYSGHVSAVSGEPLVGESPLSGGAGTASRSPQRFVRLLPLVAHYLAGAHFRAKDDAVVSGGNPFRRAAAA